MMTSADNFELFYRQTLAMLAAQEPIDRGEWQAQKTSDRPEMRTCELHNFSFQMRVPQMMGALQAKVKPHLPWAEDHFQERVSGVPINPPPSSEWWPFAKKNNAEHKKGEKFSHTYPERFWPVWAGEVYEEMQSSNSVAWEPHPGIRFPYGDLDDVVSLLRKSPGTRQAFLPIWHPEDTYAANHEERVPCTLGYHFMVDPRTSQMQITYYIRSCDMIRHFPDDVYMAGRLLQWVCEKVANNITPSLLVMHIANAHIFAGDVLRVKSDCLSAYRGEWL